MALEKIKLANIADSIGFDPAATAATAADPKLQGGQKQIRMLQRQAKE